jgi:hypothetical protein
MVNEGPGQPTGRFQHVIDCLFACREYLQSLLSYLLSFYERTQPLAQLQKQLSKLQEEVAERWGEGQVSSSSSRSKQQLAVLVYVMTEMYHVAVIRGFCCG